MSKDVRYATVKRAIEAGNINSFREIFITLPKRTMAKDLSCHYYTLARKIKDPKKLAAGDIISIADLIEIEKPLLFALIFKEQFPGQMK